VREREREREREISYPRKKVIFFCKIMYVPNEKLADTDDDLPPSHQNRVPRRSHVTGNGRSAVGSVSYLRMHSDMEAEIHHLEQEAYYSVLRAFKAQSNAITWVFTFLCSHILY
jgi:hypothetical protein